jgi:hypothetical protein
MYNNIFAATFNYYSRFKNESPRFSAACVVTVCQMVLLFLGIIILKKIGNIDIFGMLPSKYLIIPFLVIWLYLVYRYYTKEKVNQVIELFSQKTILARRLWGVLTIVHFILPIVIISFLLKK